MLNSTKRVNLRMLGVGAIALILLVQCSMGVGIFAADEEKTIELLAYSEQNKIGSVGDQMEGNTLISHPDSHTFRIPSGQVYMPFDGVVFRDASSSKCVFLIATNKEQVELGLIPVPVVKLCGEDLDVERDEYQTGHRIGTASVMSISQLTALTPDHPAYANMTPEEQGRWAWATEEIDEIVISGIFAPQGEAIATAVPPTGSPGLEEFPASPYSSEDSESESIAELPEGDIVFEGKIPAESRFESMAIMNLHNTCRAEGMLRELDLGNGPVLVSLSAAAMKFGDQTTQDANFVILCQTFNPEANATAVGYLEINGCRIGSTLDVLRETAAGQIVSAAVNIGASRECNWNIAENIIFEPKSEG